MAGSTPAMTRRGRSLRQPALATPVVLALAERLATAFRHTEVEFLHVFVLAQRPRIAVEHHAAALQHVAVARVFQCHARVLLRQQKRNPLLRLEIADDLENFFYELRREPN